jgi:DNA-binding GntR family transcriptional regulator
MAQGRRTAVQGARLRDQVYDIILEDLRSGDLKSGQRLFEVELASKYGVSRTPIREALFQLARDGLLVSNQRSYSLPVNTLKDVIDRLEVHLLIDPAVSRRAAAEGTDEQILALEKAFRGEVQAEENGRLRQFFDSTHQFKRQLLQMCNNAPLARCSALIEDLFLVGRHELYKLPEHRKIVLHYDERVLKAVKARDPEMAGRVTFEYMSTVLNRFKNWPKDVPLVSETPQPAKRRK